MSKANLLLPAALILTMAQSASVFGSVNTENEVKVLKIRGYGKACPTDANGTPKGWKVKYDPETTSFKIKLAKFKVDNINAETHCKISMILSFPAGKTMYSFKSSLTGEATIEDGESVELKTSGDFGGNNKKTEVQVLESGIDGQFTTDTLDFEANREAPCGGREYRVTIDLSAKLKGGSSSYAFVRTVEGGLSNWEFKTKKCEHGE